MSRAEKAVKRLIDAGNKRDFETIASVVADDFVWTEPFLGHKPGEGREAFKNGVKSFLDGVPDAQFTVQNILSDDIRAGFELTLTRTGSGGQQHVTSAVFIELNEAGLIHRLREYYDTATYMRDLGLS